MEEEPKVVVDIDEDKSTEGAAAKAERSERFHRFLKRLNLPVHGAATQISKKIGVTPATVSSWMQGSLPRNPQVMIKFCDTYDVDLYFWATGNPRPIDKVNPERLITAVEKVVSATQAKDLDLNMNQFSLLITECYNDPIAGDEYIERMAPLFAKKSSQLKTRPAENFSFTGDAG